LFYTLDHELTHAELFSDGTFSQLGKAAGYSYAQRYSEIMAYSGGIRVGQAWNDYKIILFSVNKLLFYYNKK
jgi:hypothetical protein